MRVVYFVAESGRRPVEEFVRNLNVHSLKKFFSVVELLEEFGKGLSFPHAKHIGDEIFELRFENIEGSVRVLYFFFDGNKAVLTNGFVKKSNKTPRREKETAVNRRQTYFQTHS